MATTVSSTSSSPTLSAPGIGSGLDVTSLVSKLMEVEQQPVTALNKKQSSYQSQLSAYGSLKSALSSLQTAAQAISTSASFSVTKASVADSSILSTTSSSSAAAGNYNIEVTTLAKAQKIASSGVSSTSTAIGGTGSLTLKVGTYTDATHFSESSSVTLNLDSSNSSLSSIQSAINNANAGVTAAIVNDGSTNRLVLTSKDTGTNHAIQISTTGDSAYSMFNYDQAGGATSMTQSVAATDASFKIDNIAITKHSNTVTDAIEGVTLNLAKTTGTGVTTQVTVAQDTSTITNNVQAFVSAYNKVVSSISSSSAYNSTTQTASIFTGDATVRTIQQTLSKVVSTAFDNGDGSKSYLSNAGISVQKDGTLALDTTKFQKALADPSQDIKKIFVTASTGYAAKMNSVVGDLVSSSGILSSRTAGLDRSIKDISSQLTAVNNRLALVEKNYYSQFNALDSALASMNSTSSYLTQQLKSLTSSSS